jgi:Putative sugar-binding domain
MEATYFPLYERRLGEDTAIAVLFTSSDFYMFFLADRDSIMASLYDADSVWGFSPDWTRNTPDDMRIMQVRDVLGISTNSILGLDRNTSIARTLDASRALDVAVVEIGGWGLGGTQVLDQLPVADRQATIDQGVVANVCGIFLGADGSLRAREVSDRLVSVWQHDLSSAAVRIGVVEGPAAAEAARAAVNSGLLTVLATDAATADLLL